MYRLYNKTLVVFPYVLFKRLDIQGAFQFIIQFRPYMRSLISNKMFSIVNSVKSRNIKISFLTNNGPVSSSVIAVCFLSGKRESREGTGTGVTSF